LIDDLDTDFLMYFLGRLCMMHSCISFLIFALLACLLFYMQLLILNSLKIF